MALEEAIASIRSLRQCSRRTSLRTIERGNEGAYWTLERPKSAPERLRLAAAHRLIERFQLDSAGSVREVPLAVLGSQRVMRAQLFAGVYEFLTSSGGYRDGALSRDLKERITGVPPRTQIEYDRIASVLIEAIHMHVEAADASDPKLVGEGFYIDRYERQRRRGADRREPRDQRRISRSAASHANVKALRQQHASAPDATTTYDEMARGQRHRARQEARERRKYFRGATRQETVRASRRSPAPLPHYLEYQEGRETRHELLMERERT